MSEATPSDTGKTRLLAVGSFIFGVLGFGPLPIIGTVLAYVLGRKAQAALRGDGPPVRDFFADFGVLMAVLQAILGGMALLSVLLLWAVYGFGTAHP